MLTVEPRGDAVRGRTHQHSIWPGASAPPPCPSTRTRSAPPGAPTAPSSRTHPYEVDLCRLHHLHVFIEPLVWHVLVIVGDAVQDRVDLRAGSKARAAHGPRTTAIVGRAARAFVASLPRLYRTTSSDPIVHFEIRTSPQAPALHSLPWHIRNISKT